MKFQESCKARLPFFRAVSRVNELEKKENAIDGLTEDNVFVKKDSHMIRMKIK